MPRNGYELQRRYLHFVDQDIEHDANDKLFKIKPILEAVRKECVKVELEEFHEVDEKKVQQYHPQKKTENGGLKIWLGQVLVGSCMTFTCMGKKNQIK